MVFTTWFHKGLETRPGLNQSKMIQARKEQSMALSKPRSHAYFTNNKLQSQSKHHGQQIISYRIGNKLITTNHTAKRMVAHLKQKHLGVCHFWWCKKETTTILPYCTTAWSSSFRGWSHKSQSWTTTQMLEVCCHKVIPMASKPCSTFFQVHQIALFTALTAS